MRAFRFALPVAVFAVAVGCEEQVLTGPEAQAAFEEAAAVAEAAPQDVVIFLDGKRILDNGDVRELEKITGLAPEDIVRIEVLKGKAAALLVSDKPVRSVVQIYTAEAGS